MGMESRPSLPGVLPDSERRSAPEDAPSGPVLAAAHLRAGSVAGLRSLRTGLGLCLEQGACGPDTIADAQLVLAEIVTNAFVHDTAPLVDVEVVCRDADITISTWHRGDVAPPEHPVQPAPMFGPPLASGGRGLAIVDQLVASRAVTNIGGCTTTVVRLGR